MLARHIITTGRKTACGLMRKRDTHTHAEREREREVRTGEGNDGNHRLAKGRRGERRERENPRAGPNNRNDGRTRMVGETEDKDYGEVISMFAIEVYTSSFHFNGIKGSKHVGPDARERTKYSRYYR